MAKNSKKPAVSSLDRNKLLVAAFVIVFGALGVYKLAFSGAAPRPKVTPAVVMSSDGCQVKTSNAGGYKFEYGAYATGKGGSDTVVVPSNGVFSYLFGAASGMTTYGKLYNNKGRVIASATKLLAAECKLPSTYTYASISSPYATSSTTPTFKGCKVATAAGTLMTYFSATRPTNDVVSFAAISGTGKSVTSYSWIGNVSYDRVEVPANDTVTLSYQTASAGYGYTAQGGVNPSSLPSCY